MSRVSLVPLLLLAVVVGQTSAVDIPPGQLYLNFVKKQGTTLRANDKPPANLDERMTRRAELRRNLLNALGGFPSEKCPLEPKILGTLTRDGYRVEKLIFQGLVLNVASGCMGAGFAGYFSRFSGIRSSNNTAKSFNASFHFGTA